MPQFVLPVILLPLASGVETAGPEGTSPTPAPAPGPAGGPATTGQDGQPHKAPAPAPGLFDGPGGIIFIVLMLGFMYFVLIRPQRKEEKRRQSLISAVKPGHKVVTIGGLHGEVVSVGEATVELRVGRTEKESVLMTFSKSAVANNLTAAEEAKK